MAEIFKKMKDYFFADPAQVDSEEMEQEFPEDLNLPSFEEEPQPERRRGGCWISWRALSMPWAVPSARYPSASL